MGGRPVRPGSSILNCCSDAVVEQEATAMTVVGNRSLAPILAALDAQPERWMSQVSWQLVLRRNVESARQNWACVAPLCRMPVWLTAIRRLKPWEWEASTTTASVRPKRLSLNFLPCRGLHRGSSPSHSEDRGAGTACGRRPQSGWILQGRGEKRPRPSGNRRPTLVHAWRWAIVNVLTAPFRDALGGIR